MFGSWTPFGGQRSLGPSGDRTAKHSGAIEPRPGASDVDRRDQALMRQNPELYGKVKSARTAHDRYMADDRAVGAAHDRYTAVEQKSTERKQAVDKKIYGPDGYAAAEQSYKQARISNKKALQQHKENEPKAGLAARVFKKRHKKKVDAWKAERKDLRQTGRNLKERWQESGRERLEAGREIDRDTAVERARSSTELREAQLQRRESAKAFADSMRDENVRAHLGPKVIHAKRNAELNLNRPVQKETSAVTAANDRIRAEDQRPRQGRRTAEDYRSLAKTMTDRRVNYQATADTMGGGRSTEQHLSTARARGAASAAPKPPPVRAMGATPKPPSSVQTSGGSTGGGKQKV